MTTRTGRLRGRPLDDNGNIEFASPQETAMSEQDWAATRARNIVSTVEQLLMQTEHGEAERIVASTIRSERARALKEAAKEARRAYEIANERSDYQLSVTAVGERIAGNILALRNQKDD